MKYFPIIVVIAAALLVAAAPVIEAQENGPEALIGRARAVSLSPHFSRDEIVQALIGVLDASLLVLPETSYAAEFKSRVETVRTMFAQKAIFEDKARQYLGLAYKLVAEGQAWAVPDELKSAYREADIMDGAKKICVALLDGALADLNAGRREQAVRQLISYVIFVITPIQA
jgi:hypothetical protein